MEKMREILSRIQNGEARFNPTDDSHKALRDFQSIAKRIVAAHERGYLVKAVFRRRNGRDTAGYITQVVITGGLTFDGEKFLESQQKEAEKTAPVSTDKPADLIKFEPKLFGIKLEGNELYRRLKRWWYGKKQ